ncbi:hypothetical protein DET49_12227 [Salegentibacter sp. 24]|nr:hypothetical protein DET49_12227 [Salegentibacter sp. 24]
MKAWDVIFVEILYAEIKVKEIIYLISNPTH